MKSKKHIQKLASYPLSSHKAWELESTHSILKLDWNEASLTIPENIKQAIIDYTKDGLMSWYPDIANKKLITAISEYTNMPSSHIQYFGGSDAALDYIVHTYVDKDDEVIFCAPTYDNFRLYVESVGGIPVHVFAHDLLDSDVDAISRHVNEKTKAIYLVNPNNPTGVLYSLEQITTILEAHPNVLLILDEAYIEFSGGSAVKLVEKYKNLIIARSLSKAFGLASFRFGYILSDPENLEQINKIRNGKSISAITQIVALTALRNTTYMQEYVDEVIRARTYTCSELEKLGLTAYVTPANFILLKIDDADVFKKKLEEKEVFVRGLTHLPSMKGYLRITIATEEIMKIFIARVKEVV